MNGPFWQWDRHNGPFTPRSQSEAEPSPEAEPEEIVWPPSLPESWSLVGSSPLERALAELLGLGEPETTARLDYVGRHRLLEPAENRGRCTSLST